MASVEYRGNDGVEVLEVPPGSSLMAAAVAEGLDGIVAECGGNAMCATCHVYLAPESEDLFPAMTDFEDAMLEETAGPRLSNSRLSCQLIITEAISAVSVTLPSEQL